MIIFVEETNRNRDNAIQLIQTHTTLPYDLSLHEYKSTQNIYEYIQSKHDWVFNYMNTNEIINIINQTKSDLIN